MPQFEEIQHIAAAHKGDPDFMLSLARGMQVLLAFSERKTPASLSEIALKTSLDRAVVRRCVYTLGKLGLVGGVGKKYALNAEVLSLGHAYFSSADLITRAQPVLDQLSEKIHTNCSLAILNQGDVVYLVRSQSRRLMQRSLGMGSRLPAHCTSLGRVLLAHMPAKEFSIYLAATQFQPLTSFTVTDKRALRTILKNIRKDGFAIVNQEIEMDLVAIAIPVRMAGYNELMALSVTVNPRYTAAEDMKARYLEAMQQAATQLLTV
ncbi:IclR family transcriptional regulator C-terminal domain-containing protein [Polaromonas sp. SM01]|uniref:IclR family transcriptional regulator domain-containing protein n=1 Tax=Polaromonas sp. SM01 TaxID=3085630 RepID=UPI002982676F|nr:IclR family transcriptional regulator C-terminal domain-containing protein [Polaromonas sp. SM01]MDW5444906.1 IclR family transcriptional regulator C-terminal domain-containing protein [Polaromonas sp. SM01]